MTDDLKVLEERMRLGRRLATVTAAVLAVAVLVVGILADLPLGIIILATAGCIAYGASALWLGSRYWKMRVALAERANDAPK